jgi:hypothetical protein
MRNEQGGARLKFIIFIAVFALILYAGYMYIPVAIDAYYFKDVMQNKVDLAVAQGFDGNWVREQLAKSGPEYHVPAEASLRLQRKRIAWSCASNSPGQFVPGLHLQLRVRSHRAKHFVLYREVALRFCPRPVLFDQFPRK